MGNMSYCRFENTANDVRDCMEALEDLDVKQVAEMSEHEKQALIEFIELSNEISNQFKLDTIQELVEESESYDEYEDED